MELKYPESDSRLLQYAGSNRTFMELKCINKFHKISMKSVLIVPLWN